MTGTIQYRFTVRGGTAAALAARNEIPLARELVVETDTERIKLGDGITPYNALEYISIDGLERFTTDDLTEGATNLYFTPARAIAAVGGISGGEVLVQDGSSAPPVMLTNEAEDDFIHSG